MRNRGAEINGPPVKFVSSSAENRTQDEAFRRVRSNHGAGLT